MVGAVICALYAWLGVQAAGAVIAGYAITGAVLGAIAAVVLAILFKLLELAIKLLVICVQIALVHVHGVSKAATPAIGARAMYHVR